MALLAVNSSWNSSSGTVVILQWLCSRLEGEGSMCPASVFLEIEENNTACNPVQF